MTGGEWQVAVGDACRYVNTAKCGGEGGGDVVQVSQGNRWSRDSRLLECIFTLRSQY